MPVCMQPVRLIQVSMATAVIALALSGCASAGRGADARTEVERLAEWMSGSFSSAAQAAEDPQNYRDVRLHMARIWASRQDGPWLYVEQAMASSTDKPYRQRVYRLRAAAERGALESQVFELPGDPLVFAGAWQDAAMLEGLSPEMLSERQGCTIVLKPADDGEVYVGSTVGKDCASTLRGAAYATSEVRITSERLESWDRGFDQGDQQVWGAEKGGYIFVKE